MGTCCRERHDPGQLMLTKHMVTQEQDTVTKHMVTQDTMDMSMVMLDTGTKCMATLTREQFMESRQLRTTSVETVVTQVLAHRSLSREDSFHQYKEETAAGN